METSRKAKNLPENLFLFREQNRDFVAGKASKPFVTKPQVVMKRWLYLVLIVVVPIAVILALLFITTTDLPLVNAILYSFIFAVCLTSFFIFIGFRFRSTLYKSDTVLIGHITSYEDAPMYSKSGITQGTRLKYTFTTPNGRKIEASLPVSTNKDLLVDGRDFPEVGTPVAVLYANDSVYTLL